MNDDGSTGFDPVMIEASNGDLDTEMNLHDACDESDPWGQPTLGEIF